MRIYYWQLAWVMGVLCLSATAMAQPAASEGGRMVSRTIVTVDGWNLPIDYYQPATAGANTAISQNTATVILLHGSGGNRRVWRSLGQKLQQAGMAAIAIDLRKHGESQPPPGYRGSITRLSAIDYQLMATVDLDAVKGFLLEEHQKQQINIRKTAIIAADEMVPIAMSYTIADWLAKPYPDAPILEARTPRGQDIRALAMLSPVNVAGRLSSNLSAGALRKDGWPGSVWIGVGQEDRTGQGVASSIHDRLVAGNPISEQRVLLVELPQAKVRGTELLTVQGLEVENQLVQFMEQRVKALPDPWRTRISRLE